MVMCARLQLSQVEAFWKIFFAEKNATSATQSLYITISQRIAGIVRVAVGSSRGAEKWGLACRFLPIPPAARAGRLRPHFCNLLPLEDLSNAFGTDSERIGQHRSVPARRSVISPSADGVR